MQGFTSVADAARKATNEILADRLKLRPGVQRFEVTDRASWLARRAEDVTASVAGALLGVHDYQTAYGLWALKSGLIAEDPEETPPMRRGRLLEPVALQLLGEERPDWTVFAGTAYYRDPETRIGATPDAIAFAPDRPGYGVIQIKNVEPGVFARTWRDPETREISPPLWIAVQAIVEAHMIGASWATVAPMRVGFGLDIDVIDIPLHAGLISRIETAVADFWRRVDAKEAPAPDYGRDAVAIALLNRADDSLPPVDLAGDNEVPGLLDEREAIKDRARTDSAREKEIRSALLHKLGAHAIGLVPDGRMIVRKIQHRSGYTVAPTSFETLTVKAAGRGAGRRAPSHTISHEGPF